MAIVTISRGSYSKGKEIAEKVAKELGYECVSRDILLEASEQFNIPEIKLVRALHDAPSVLGRFTFGKEKYVAFIEEAFLQHMQKDNIVYHGLAGHFFLKNVGHALKVRILADLEDRIRLEMEREKISEDEARHVLKKDDHERHKWAMALYGVDTTDPFQYDLVLHIGKMTVSDAVDIVCHTARLPHFQTTDESRRILANIVLASRAKVEIVKEWPPVSVCAENGVLFVDTKCRMQQEGEVVARIEEAARRVPGVKEVRVSTHPIV
ncbi:MAG: cytidylate kinase-like family protein [Deltaproteobacteria bacterium]|nr:cytidylate kinase-like family protein [Deltaproteobacteria bacterium]